MSEIHVSPGLMRRLTEQMEAVQRAGHEDPQYFAEAAVAVFGPEIAQIAKQVETTLAGHITDEMTPGAPMQHEQLALFDLPATAVQGVNGSQADSATDVRMTETADDQMMLPLHGTEAA